MDLKYVPNQHTVRYVQEGGVGYAYVDFFPGDSEIAIINGVYLPIKERKKGVGGAQHKERLDLVKELGVPYVLCTSNNDNVAENIILERNNWERLRVLEYVTLWFKDLRDKPEDINDVEPE